MPTRRTSTKKTRSEKRAGLSLPPYGDPLREAIASGDVQKMKATAASTRAWLKEINALLDKLDKQIKSLGTK